MIQSLIGAIVGMMLLSGCGYQGWVRYPCQEFENWEKAKCQPPQCEPLGLCTKDLFEEGVIDG